MKKLVYLLLGTILLFSCKKDLPMSSFFSTTPFIIETPFGFSDMNIPSNNPMTTEGVALGEKLFHDKILSGNGM